MAIFKLTVSGKEIYISEDKTHYINVNGQDVSVKLDWVEDEEIVEKLNK